MTRRRVLATIAVVIAAAAGCGTDPAGVPRPHLDPDVPSWRGGCFLSGATGKLMNAVAAAEVVPFGDPCADPGQPAGLVYLDRFDPVSGDGDVTVLSSGAGATPVVVAPHGGGGAVRPGSTGARLDPSGARLLTLARVSFVTGDLVEAPLPAGTPIRTVASGVRIDNYDFTAGGGILYVGDYDASLREGELLYVDGGPPRRIGAAASRFDFLMYRLAPDRARVAWLRGWTDESGGDLLVQTLPPGADPAPLASRVHGMAWTDAGQLVFRTVNEDGLSDALWVWSGSAPVQLAPAVHSALLVGGDVVFTTGWSVLEQRVALHLVAASGGDDRLGGAGPASLAIAASRPPGSDGVLAYLAVPAVTVASEGELVATRLSTFAPRSIDVAVSAEAGVRISPGAGFLSYSIGFAAPQAPASANPQPGIAHELKIASVETGRSFVLARDASTFVAWDPRERFAAAVEAFAPASNRGDLVLRRTADGAALLSVPRVGNGQFGFAEDGTFAWAIQDWDDAMRRGTLVVSTLSDDAASPPAALSTDVIWVSQARGGRVLYGVRGEARDGLWLGAAP